MRTEEAANGVEPEVRPADAPRPVSGTIHKGVVARMLRIAKIASGFALLIAGAAMVVLPGPGWLTIAAGLAVLAGEFPWARRALDRLKDIARAGRDQVEKAVARWRRSSGNESSRP
jgi:hypothetical protein